MDLAWAVFVLAIAGWLGLTAVLWLTLYPESKRRVGTAAWWRPGTPREEADEPGDSAA